MGRWSVRVGDAFLPWLGRPGGLRWLDVGCGNGAFTELIAGRCAPASVDGIDPSPGQLDYARARPSLGAVRFHQGDAQALPFPDASFDVATMALVIIFVPDPVAAVAEMRRVVRPGGCVATYMWDVAGGGLPVRWAFEAIEAVGLTAPVLPGTETSSLASLRGFWDAASFAEVETRVIEIEVAYDDFADLWTSYTRDTAPVGRALAALSAADLERVRVHLDATLPRDAAGRIVFGAHANAVKGRVA